MTQIKKQKTLLLLKTLFIASIVGLIVGALDALFGRVLLYVSNVRNQYLYYLLPLLGLGGFLTVYAYKKISEESLKGMSLVIETGLGKNEKIPLPLVPLIMISTWITHLLGGSAGREGVAVQMGATVSHFLGRKLKMPDNSRILLITGMAAGFGGLFQTPLAATFFALEVMITGVMQYDALLPAITAAFLASNVSHYLGLEKFSVPITEQVNWSAGTTIKLVFIAILFGLTGRLFAYLLKQAKAFFADKIKNPLHRIFFMGCCLAIILSLLHTGRYCGLGTNLISDSFTGSVIYSYDWILKILLTVLTLAAGYQGGEVTPLFSIGASLGIILGTLLGLPPMLIAGLGYAAVFGSATNTLLAPIFIGVEVFGTENIIPFTIVCLIAYSFNGNQSIYGAQKNFTYTTS